jgi:hypothetical protein
MNRHNYEALRKKWRKEAQERFERNAHLSVNGEVKTYTWRELPDGHPIKEKFLSKERE